VLPFILALGASGAWGSADFMAGLASRRLPVITVLLVSQAFGFAILALAVAILVTVRREPLPELQFVLAAAGSGAFSALALAAFYRGLAVGTMSVVAPIAATDALVPVLFAMGIGQSLTGMQAVGAGLALIGVVLASRPGEGERADRRRVARGVWLALLAALAFGLYVVTLDAASEASVMWAVFFNRLTALALIAAAALISRPALDVRSAGDAYALLSIGVLDVMAGTLFAGATAAGLLGYVGVIGSLYPVITVVLAGIVLRERLTRGQRLGAAIALAGATVLAFTLSG